MSADPSLGGMSEQRFFEDQLRYGLRKPQVAADTLLRALTVAADADRVPLIAAIVEQLADAALRLAAVYQALSDRSVPAARRLAAGDVALEHWQEVVHLAGTLSPEQLTSRMGLGESGIEASRQLRGQPDLARVSAIVDAVTRRRLRYGVGPGGRRCVVVPAGAGEEESRISGDEDAAAAFADLTAELSEIARGLLGAYVRGRTFPQPGGGA